MGYRIVYGKEKRKLTKRKKILLLSIIACGLLIVFVCFGGIRLLLPGDPQVSAAALENLVEAVWGGETLCDAIETFCQEIITNAQTSQ